MKPFLFFPSHMMSERNVLWIIGKCSTGSAGLEHPSNFHGYIECSTDSSHGSLSLVSDDFDNASYSQTGAPSCCIGLYQVKDAVFFYHLSSSTGPCSLVPEGQDFEKVDCDRFVYASVLFAVFPSTVDTKLSKWQSTMLWELVLKATIIDVFCHNVFDTDRIHLNFYILSISTVILSWFLLIYFFRYNIVVLIFSTDSESLNEFEPLSVVVRTSHSECMSIIAPVKTSNVSASFNCLRAGPAECLSKVPGFSQCAVTPIKLLLLIQQSVFVAISAAVFTAFLPCFFITILNIDSFP